MNIIKKIGVLVSICLIGTGAYAEQCRNPGQLRFSIIPTEESSFELDLYKPILLKLKKTRAKKLNFTCQLLMLLLLKL